MTSNQTVRAMHNCMLSKFVEMYRKVQANEAVIIVQRHGTIDTIVSR